MVMSPVISYARCAGLSLGKGSFSGKAIGKIEPDDDRTMSSPGLVAGSGQLLERVVVHSGPGRRWTAGASRQAALDIMIHPC